MATKPTRQQQRACDHLAQAILLFTEAARLDGKSAVDRDAFTETARRLAQASSAFTLDEIVARAIERRGHTLGLPSTTSDLLSLMETDMKPLETLLLTDDEFRGLVEQMIEELGEI